MDFTNFIDFINTYIPSSIAGIDTLYIILALVLLLLIIWLISKVKKIEPTRELVDLVPEEVDENEFGKVDNTLDEEVEENIEENGFMPSNIPQEIHVSEELEEEKSTSATAEEISEEIEVELEEEAVEDEALEDEALEEARTSSVTRKKRNSTREGKKVSKADFSDFSGQRLLIAEDNLINQKVINGVLNDSGIEVVMADDGQFVMDILEKDRDFEIILMDAHMPRLDGFEATRQIRENPAYDHIAVIALSGDTAVDDIRHMTEAGMEEHLEKPLKMNALYDVMSMYYTMDEKKEAEAQEQVEELEITVDVKDLACLDYDLGLEICGNDEGMYKSLLKEFFLAYKDSSKKLHEALMKKDYKQAQNILIDVKGTASNLGAKQFIYTAEQFLEALSIGNTSIYSELFRDYQSYLLALLKSIQQAFKV